MNRKNISFALGASLIAGLAGSPAWASPQGNDLCITFTAAPNPYVQVLLNGWSQIPGKSKCTRWNGFTPQNGTGAQFGLNNPSTGTMCLSADGTNLTFNLETQELGVIFWDDITVPGTRSGITGQSTELQFGNSEFATTPGQPFLVPVTLARCNAPAIPAGVSGTGASSTNPDAVPDDSAAASVSRHVGAE